MPAEVDDSYTGHTTGSGGASSLSEISSVVVVVGSNNGDAVIGSSLGSCSEAAHEG